MAELIDRDRLIENGDGELVDEEFLGCRQHHLVPHRNADVGVFSNEELATIDKVFADLDGLNVRQVSDLSHDEAGLRLVDFGDTIPHCSCGHGHRPGVLDLVPMDSQRRHHRCLNSA